jgi:cysteine-rich repeat protein
VCGDGNINEDDGEVCDDGDIDDGDGCDSNCTPTGCGNGIVSPGEGCDDLNLANGDGCDSSCEVEDGYDCSAGPWPSICTPVCGDSIVIFPKIITDDSASSTGEHCDDGNIDDGDGCESDCEYTPVNETVGAGGTVTTDTAATGATGAFPIQASVTTPDGGTVSINVQNAGGLPGGFSSLGVEFDISAPPASAADPLMLVFLIHESVVPPGLDVDSIELFRNGVLVPDCTGAPGIASPDPCVADRQESGGVFQISALTSAASIWSLGFAVCGNSITEAGEECDDGNTIDGDCCSSTCDSEPVGGACADDFVGCTIDTCDGAGACQHAPDDTACDDGSPCTQDTCSVDSGGCISDAAPVTSCANDAPGKARLMMTRDDDEPTKNKVQFKWLKGNFDASILGDPTASNDYALCVYAEGGIVAQLSVPAGTMSCGTKPCWSLIGSPPSGIKYKDPEKPPVRDGVKQILGKSSLNGKAKVQVKAQGSSVPEIALGDGLDYPVTAQVVTRDGACWEATFTQADEKKNNPTMFKAMH